MILALVAIIFVGVFAWIYSRWLSVKQHWAQRNVPHHPPHPILGSLTFLLKKNPGIWMREMYKEFKAPYVGIWLFWRPALIINDPDIARRVLIRDADNFRDRFLGSGKSDPIGNLNMFTVNDPTWTAVRRPLTSIFTSAKLKSLHGLMSMKAKQIIQRIHNDNQEKNKIEIRTLFSDFATDIIGTSAFGVGGDATLTGDSPMRSITKEFQKFSIYRGLCWSSIFFFPELVDVFRFTLFPKFATDYFRRIFKTVVKQRGGYDGNTGEHKDLLDALIKMKRDANNSEVMTEDNLISQAAIFLQGGFDTSASALSFAVYELAYAPDEQEILYQEVKEAKEKLGEADFDPTVLSELPYLNAVIKETLRLYPPMGWLDRVTAKSYKIDDNLTIPAGTPTYVNAIGFMSDPEFYPEPLKFDPTRFLPENEKNNKSFTYMPFGEGPRNCIGKRFAQYTMRYAMSSVILNFEIRPVAGAPYPSELEPEKKGLFLMPGDPLTVEFVPRN